MEIRRARRFVEEVKAVRVGVGRVLFRSAGEDAQQEYERIKRGLAPSPGPAPAPASAGGRFGCSRPFNRDSTDPNPTPLVWNLIGRATGR
jgi:hypothetical protein